MSENTFHGIDFGTHRSVIVSLGEGSVRPKEALSFVRKIPNPTKETINLVKATGLERLSQIKERAKNAPAMSYEKSKPHRIFEEEYMEDKANNILWVFGETALALDYVSSTQISEAVKIWPFRFLKESSKYIDYIVGTVDPILIDAYNAAKAFTKFLTQNISEEEKKSACIAIGVPPHADEKSFKVLQFLVHDIGIESAIAVSEPYLVYVQHRCNKEVEKGGKSEEEILIELLATEESQILVVDIGALTTDICITQGIQPPKIYQRTIYKGGNYIDKVLFDLVKKRLDTIKKEQNIELLFDETKARELKEKYSRIYDIPGDRVIWKPKNCFINGKMQAYHGDPIDLTEEIKIACASLTEEIAGAIQDVVGQYLRFARSESRADAFLKQILLCGGGSQIKGLEKHIKEKLVELLNKSPDDINVIKVDDAVYAGGMGAYNYATLAEPEDWESNKKMLQKWEEIAYKGLKKGKDLPNLLALFRTLDSL